MVKCRHLGLLSILGLLLTATSCQHKEKHTITVGIAPYQDIAMIVNINQLGLEKKYGVNVKLLTMAWEDILPGVASSGRTIDLGFGSLIEYLTKEQSVNPPGADPVLFIYPAYIFKGGAFITFDPHVSVLTKDSIKDPEPVKQFLSYRIGAQKESVYEMMIYSLARRGGVDFRSIKLFDTPLNDGILAAQRGSLDIAEAGLTQLSEARKQGGRVALTMEDLGFADVTGFICKKSTLDSEKPAIESVIKMWFESVHYVMKDIDRNSAVSLDYLRKHASTQYTLPQYKDALSEEFFPQSPEDVQATIISDAGQFSYRRIGQDVNSYLVTVRKIGKPSPVPEMITLGK